MSKSPKETYSPLKYSGRDVDRKYGSKPDEKKNMRGIRLDFERDRARIVQSAAFRRLQGKTQLFVVGESDFFRTRLTHSLEVALIGKAIATILGADTALVEAISLAHDIGHPPFGHTGEEELAVLMKDWGGFEANAQNLRIVRFLEKSDTRYEGLNLTRATIDGLLKYKTAFRKDDFDDAMRANKPYKCYYRGSRNYVKWASEDGPLKKQSFECQIMDWADDIAYSVHDLEDGIRAGMIGVAQLNRKETRKRILLHAKETYGSDATDDDLDWAVKEIGKLQQGGGARSEKALRKQMTARLISQFIQACKRGIRDPSAKSERYKFEVVIEEQSKRRCTILKCLTRQLILDDSRVVTLAYKARKILRSLFEAFGDKDNRELRRLFPEDFKELLDKANTSEQKMRFACDYLSGMTDEYAKRVYARLYLPAAGSVFEL